ncbi:MAG: hypothetical protein ACI82I_001571 [Gammaproteobacteria bacterium]
MTHHNTRVRKQIVDEAVAAKFAPWWLLCIKLGCLTPSKLCKNDIDGFLPVIGFPTFFKNFPEKYHQEVDKR